MVTMLVIQAKHRHGGFYIARVPSSLDAAQVDSAFREAGIDPTRVFEINQWQTTSNGVKIAYLPFRREN